VCEFQNSCLEKLIERDDLSLLTSLKSKEIIQRNNRGIFSVKQLSYTFRPKKNPYRKRKFLPELKALAIREGKTFIQEIPDIPASRNEIFLDIEGLPDRNFYYLIGIIIKANDSEKTYSFWANNKDEEEKIFIELIGLLQTLDEFVIYHYGTYEIQALKIISKKVSPKHQEFLKKVIDSSFNVLDIFTHNICPPTYSNSLKDIARLLKFEWTEKDASGLQSIKKQSCYIWVFTNVDTVFYLFKPTREAEFLKELLVNFKGVLISDFYAGYDSMSCPKQRCLIHLIRDLNDDLVKHQLNSELKIIVLNFSKLLTGIMNTVNRFGLKKRNLNKHKKSVESFFKSLSKMDFETEVCSTWQKRFNSIKNELFTFLNYDGVPWNNNNAETAIKAFAVYRKQTDGLPTQKGIEEYLTLLSIQQTCKYRGINFFEFLKSGETSISAYSGKHKQDYKPNNYLCKFVS